MICRICGEDKQKRDFYRLKHFYKYLNVKRIWCRGCMKLFVEMKREEKKEKELQQKEWIFCVKFD